MRLIVLGTVIDTDDMRQTLDRLVELVADGRARRISHQIATINADFLVHATDDPEVQNILLGASHATADGMPLVWGSRLLGVPVTERVTGADLVPEFAAVAARKQISFYFLGAAEGVAQQAADILIRDNPGLKVVGVDAPTIEAVSSRDPGILQRISDADPDVLFVAFGAPKQDKWIDQNLSQLDVPVCIGVGGTFDFITGRTTRAPVWIRRIGLEWLHRLCNEPRRLWRRYFRDLTYFPGAFFRQWRAVRYNGPAELTVSTSQAKDQITVDLDGALVQSTSDRLRAVMATTQPGSFVVIDARNLTHVDSVGLAALVDFAVAARKTGGSLVWENASTKVLAAIDAASLTRFFRHCAAPAEDLTVDQPPSVAIGHSR